jgi:thiosulfate/3-mercaptopyruvate sulfurtransferase
MKFLQLFQPKSLIVAAFVITTPVAVGGLATLTGLAATPAIAVDVIRFDQKWLVSVDEARALIASGALVLDARHADLKTAAPLANAQPILFQDLVDQHGRLLTDDSALNDRLQRLGVDAGQPIVVVADPLQGLGEDAQIVWALRSLGHARVVMVDGGLPALLAAGLPTIQPPFGRGNFRLERQGAWSIDAAEIKTRQRDLTLLASDFAPDLLGAEGGLLGRERIDALLAAKGIDRDSNVVPEDSSPRAAFLTAVLVDLGYNARQQAGSVDYALTAAN